MKTLLLGGSGTLGTELQKLDNSIIAPPRTEVDIRLESNVYDYLKKIQPDVVILSAAVIDNNYIESYPNHGILTNIIGTSNVALVCHTLNIRLIYISTDYVYNGNTNNQYHKETDDINPANLYAWTKLGGECAVRCVTNHLIIRTSFGTSKFPYNEAFDKQYTSKDYVDNIAPMILHASHSNTQGILNIGTERKTLYEYALTRNPNITKLNTKYKDYSLNTTKYNEIN